MAIKVNVPVKKRTLELIYFEDLENLLKEEISLQTPFSSDKFLTDNLVKEFVTITDDDAPSHTNIYYNKVKGRKDIFIPAYLIPGISEGYFRQYHKYATDIIRSYSIKLLRPLFPGDRIRIADRVIEVNNKIITKGNTSPVTIERRIENQYGLLTSSLEIYYLINRK